MVSVVLVVAGVLRALHVHVHVHVHVHMHVHVHVAMR